MISESKEYVALDSNNVQFVALSAATSENITMLIQQLIALFDNDKNNSNKYKISSADCAKQIDELKKQFEVPSTLTGKLRY